MSEEITKCHKPNEEAPMCRECKRRGVSEINEYQAFNITKDKDTFSCEGYVSIRQSGSLFDE